jgi:hypothetical protein
MLIQAHLRTHRKKKKKRMENANKKMLFSFEYYISPGDFLPLSIHKIKNIKMLFY